MKHDEKCEATLALARAMKPLKRRWLIAAVAWASVPAATRAWAEERLLRKDGSTAVFFSHA
jgi:hypothetical protein